MTTYDFIELSCGSFIMAIYDMDSGRELYRGWSSELPCQFEDLEVMSFDAPTPDDNALIINIETGVTA